MKRKITFIFSFGLVSSSGEEKNRFRERKSNFSLDFPAFGLLVLVEAIGEVDLHCKGYAWTPILWSFDNFER